MVSKGQFVRKQGPKKSVHTASPAPSSAVLKMKEVEVSKMRKEEANLCL